MGKYFFSKIDDIALVRLFELFTFHEQSFSSLHE